MRSRLLLGCSFVSAVVLGAFACGEGGSGEVASIGLIMSAPQGVLDGATDVKLSVFDADAGSCDAAGHVDAIPSTGTQTFALTQQGCPSGLSWCKTITLDKDGSSKIFAVQVSRGQDLIAEGCTTATVNQDPLEVSIQIQRATPPACCGDGKIQVSEQCDAGGLASCGGVVADEACQESCTAREIAVDRAATAAETYPAVGAKSALALAFAPGTGEYTDGLRAVFNDPSNAGDVQLRVLRSDLFSVASPLVLSSPQILQRSCGGSTPITTTQRNASLAPVGADLLAVAYEDDFASPQARVDIRLMALDSSSCPSANPQQVNTTLVSSSKPSIARGPGGDALIVWTNASNQLLGRIYRGGAGLDAAEIAIATGATAARVAGGTDAWTIAYSTGAGVFTRTVSADGSVGAESRVDTPSSGTASQPSVAMFDDGRTLVAWQRAGDIYFQRYDAAGTKIAGDQGAPLNTTLAGDQSEPTVAASKSGGDFFTIAWTSEGSIRARFAGAASGFLYNGVTGQNADFDATDPAIAGQRSAPTLAISGQYVVIGWEDRSAAHPGVYVRRFPFPATE